MPLDRIIATAVSLLDEDGADALSMRNLAQALKVEAMSLYNHIDGKAALLDGLFEMVLARLPAPPTSRTAS